MSFFALCLALSSVNGLSADVVHLTNGRRLEGIVLSESDGQVRLRLPFGEIGLPVASVERIERESSLFAEYLERREELSRAGAPADAWLDLALWAKAEALDHCAREAALVAAALAPETPRLTPLMHGFGYVLDETRGEWVPYDEMMRRHGFVRSNGQWLSRDQAIAATQAREATQLGRLERERQERLTRTLELIAMAQLLQAEEARHQRQAAADRPVGIPVWGYPIAVSPGYWLRPPMRPEPYRAGHAGVAVEARELPLSPRPPTSRGPLPPEPNRGGIQRIAGNDQP